MLLAINPIMLSAGSENCDQPLKEYFYKHHHYITRRTAFLSSVRLAVMIGYLKPRVKRGNLCINCRNSLLSNSNVVVCSQ